MAGVRGVDGSGLVGLGVVGLGVVEKPEQSGLVPK